jgi:hypothetical protein
VLCGVRVLVADEAVVVERAPPGQADAEEAVGLFSTIMTLSTPQDVTLQELHIETFFPADEASARAWQRVAMPTVA